jgi:glycerol-3-phosphate O-acyltransferase/dihydroxyacetone phosphate acyltransferase
LRALGKVLMGAFFRDIQVVGLENFPKTGPAVVVANHFNSLIDGAAIATYLPRMPRFLAASTVWDNKPLIPLLNAAGVVPLFRRQDGRAQSGKLDEAFAKSTGLLAAGGVLAIFPEGISHNDPAVRPLKSGTARIALEAEQTKGPLDLKIVPVGLDFDAKSRFRSRILVEIGMPISIDLPHAQTRNAAQKPAAHDIKRLTGQIQDGLRDVTHNHETWEEAQLITRAADIWVQNRPEQSSDPAMGDTAASRRAIRAGYLRIRTDFPERTDALRQNLRDYDVMLGAAGLRDAQVGAPTPPALVLRFLARSLFGLIVRLPRAALGLVLNGVPYLILGVISRGKALDKRATWSVFAGLFVFPLIWTLEAILAGLWAGYFFGAGWGQATAAAIFILAPLTGRSAMSFGDVLTQMRQETRAWIVFRSGSRLKDRLISSRKALLEELADLAQTPARIDGPD